MNSGRGSDVVVVGAGISGVACARELGAAGLRVRLLDRGYQDAHLQFVEPVLAASGDALADSRAIVKGAS